ncbi:hypothetical protein HPB47_017179, partial [Ixodes persulcatus]
MQRVASSGRCAVSVWGAMSKDGVGPLVRLDGRFTAEAYSGLIDTVLLPHALDGPFGDGFFYFQQDRSPVHMTAAVTRCLEDRGVMVLEWPPQGADMNPIENVGGAMKDSVDDPWATVEAEWERLLESDLAERLFESLPRRMAD